MSIHGNETPGSTTPEVNLENRIVVTEMTPAMLLEDLAMGRGREEIEERYAYKDENGTVQPFEAWMIKEMFKDTLLKNKKASKKRLLPFAFKSTVIPEAPEQTAPEPEVTDSGLDLDDQEAPMDAGVTADINDDLDLG
jgi:hypothetical protein